MSSPKFKVGDKVDYVNDFGVLFPNHTVISIDDDAENGEIRYFIDTDCRWCSKKEKNLHKPGTYKPKNFDLLLRNGKTAKFLCHDSWGNKVYIVPDDEKELEAVLVDGSLYTRNSYEEPCCKFDNDLQPDITSNLRSA